MSLIDWFLVGLPLLLIFFVTIKTQKHVRDVSDFLTGGRVAGRYVLTVAQGQAGFGLISLVAMFELYYNSGFGIGFWNALNNPITMLITLTGFVIYRFRETRAMTMAQFFEIRYSRKFRIFTGVLQSITGIINYGLFPGVGARFIMYYTNLPTVINIAGFHISTLAVVMAFFLGVAIWITVRGGQITIMVTDCIQGVLSYPMYLIVIVALLCIFSWRGQIAPSLLDRPPGESLVNPFDTYNLRDFNLFYIFVGLFASVYNTMSWNGTQGYNASAINPHEQKMGRVLGMWRGGFSSFMYVLLAMAALTFMTHSDFKDRAFDTEQNLTWKTLNDIAPSSEYVGVDASETLIEIRKNAMTDKQSQVFSTISKQMRVPMALRNIFPVGVTGLFCALMMFLMITSDTTALHSWGSILVQDVVVPLQKKPLEPRRHLLYLRLAIICVAAYAFFFSFKYGQVTYILMFFALTGSIWLGGAGAVIIGGFYWRRGTTAAAFSTMILGSLIAICGFIGTQFWTSWIYPAISQNPDTLEFVSRFVESVSRPFEPVILWRVTPDQFPLNGQEILFLNMILSISCYIIVSLLTCKEPFNMERMLHRGKYRRKDDISKEITKLKNLKFTQRFIRIFLGITDEYTKGDRIIAWSVFIYVFFYTFVVMFLVVIIWNVISPWPNTRWSTYYFIVYFIVSASLGLVSTVWFTICTSIDLKKMFRRIAERQRNDLDDGRVVGHVNADDVAMVEQIENRKIVDDEAD